MKIYYTAYVTRKSQLFGGYKTTFVPFETYDLFKSYVVDNAGDPDVSKQRLLKIELDDGVPKVTELKLSFKDNLVVFEEVQQ